MAAIGIDKELDRFIEDYIEYIENDEWDIIYHDIPHVLTGKFTKVMLDAEINTMLEHMNEIPDDFLRHQSVTLFHIPSNIEHIGDNAFFFCDLRTLVIPEGVRSIGASAFEQNDNLTTVKLPASLKLIDEFAFSDCPNLKNFYCDCTKADFKNDLKCTFNVFQSCGTRVIHCSDGDLVFTQYEGFQDVEQVS